MPFEDEPSTDFKAVIFKKKKSKSEHGFLTSDLVESRLCTNSIKPKYVAVSRRFDVFCHIYM